MLLFGLYFVALSRGPVPSCADPFARERIRAFRRTTPYIFLASFLALLVGSVGVVTQATISTPAPRYFAATGGYGAVVAAVGIGLGVLARMRA
ncbi:MAG: hypothetical protein WDA27_14880, partial [Actinomycetota bacterium]